MKVLLTVASFAPSYGGPAVSVSRLAAAIASIGGKVGLWAPDGSALVSPVVRESAAHAPGHAITCLPAKLGHALNVFGRPDICHDNGVWLPYCHALANAASRDRIPRVVSTRGMLEPWAFNYKWLKKRLAWRLYQCRDIARAALLHATSQSEADSLERLGFDVPVTIAPNGMDLPPPLPRGSKGGRTRTLLFLSRVHPKKGLPLLVDAFAKLKPSGWRVVIAGPDELGHTAEVKALASSRGVGAAFDFVGPHYGSAKVELFAGADVFIQPTHSENFGMAVAEALSYGLPVLTTRGAPWKELETERCGWWVDPNADGIFEGLSKATSSSKIELQQMGDRGRTLISSRYCWENVSATIMSAYSATVDRHST
ncbi:MAG: glycosyltransferase [Pseudomonadota bacterium]